MRLEHIFDMQIQATSANEVAPFGGREGYLAAAGEGTVEGAEIKGTVSRFSFFERNREDGSCVHTLDGVIETEDGATILLDVSGVLHPDQAGPGVWGVVSGVKFIAQDERYGWLNGVLGVGEGTLEPSTGQGRFHFYAAVNDLVRQEAADDAAVSQPA